MPANKKLDELKAVWKRTFGDDNEFIDYYFAHYDGADSRIVHRADGKIVAEMHYHPFMDAGNECAYIYGVATLPEYRRQGIARKMLGESMRALRERGGMYVMLIAAEPSLRHWYATMDFILVDKELTVRGAIDGESYDMDDAAMNRGMYRIVDARKYLARYAAHHPEAEFFFRLDDTLIAENSGSYCCRKGKISFTPGIGDDTGETLSPGQLIERYPLDFTTRITIEESR